MSEKLITLGGGCFWCLDSAFRQIEGILTVESGYAGGHIPNPSYEQICTGNTGHAEVVQLRYDPDVISTQQILTLFFQLHDPTTLNRQGSDVGPQYRSVIFFHTEDQQLLAESMIKALDAEKIWPSKIVTQVKPCDNYYPAERYHQDYVSHNSSNPYCQAVVLPKLKKFFASQQTLLK